MEDGNVDLFYGKHNLDSYIYYYYLPNQPFQSKVDLSNTITKYKGKITLSLSSNSIMILESKEEMKTKEFKKETKSFSSFYIYNTSTLITIVSSNKSIKDNRLKCILLKDIKSALEKYEAKERQYEELFSLGLPKNADRDSLVAVYLPNDIEKKAHYHQSEKLTKDKLKYGRSDYDILSYIPVIPGGFSVFSTIEEKNIIMEYMQKDFNKHGIGFRSKSVSTVNANNNNLNQNNANNKNNNQLDYIANRLKPRKQKICLTPEPTREHLYCHLCRKRYKEFFSHLKGELHVENINKNKTSFDRLVNTFIRINSHYKEERDNNRLAIISESNNVISKGELKSNQSETQNDINKTQAFDNTHNNGLTIREGTPQTQTSTITNSNYNHNDIDNLKAHQKRFGKRKYAEFLKNRFSMLGENGCYLQIRDTHKVTKSNK